MFTNPVAAEDAHSKNIECIQTIEPDLDLQIVNLSKSTRCIFITLGKIASATADLFGSKDAKPVLFAEPREPFTITNSAADYSFLCPLFFAAFETFEISNKWY